MSNFVNKVRMNKIWLFIALFLLIGINFVGAVGDDNIRRSYDSDFQLRYNEDEDDNCKFGECLSLDGKHCYSMGTRYSFIPEIYEHMEEEIIPKYATTYIYCQDHDFVYQKSNGESCVNNFECQTYICLNNICIDLNEEISRLVNVRIEEIKQGILSNLSTLSQENNKNCIIKSNVTEGFLIPITGDTINSKGTFFSNILNKIKKIF